MKKLISIIIVNYESDESIIKCLKSIYGSKSKTAFEIIVVDNSKSDELKKSLSAKFRDVIYIESPKNLGFGAGNNLGKKQAKGDYLFFLNPDTQLVKNVIDELYKLIISNKKIGVVAPLLLDKNRHVYKLQGTKTLTPLRAIFALSFLGRLKIRNGYYVNSWNKDGLREVDVCPGSAFMVSKKLFEKLKGFDENFFLYFEEFDFCKRVRELGLKIYITSKTKVIHEWGVSTDKFEGRDKVFSKSRFYYFKKHYGLFQAFFTECFLRINKFTFFIILLFSFSLFLRAYSLTQSMKFIGDQGWFYLAARDLLLTGKIPLVGITSSHTWLHQGPLWTYILSIALFLGKFNPISGGYVTALFGALSAVLMYKLGLAMFSRRVGVIAALLYGTSPLVIFFDRMPYHTSLIPFFTLLYFFALFKWLKGSIKYFPLILLSLAILYNLELATFALSFPFAVFIVYGFIKNKTWFKKLFNKKILMLSFISLLVPMLPVIIYDFSHGFKQTIVFFGWTLYKPFSFLVKHSSGNLLLNSVSVFNFLTVNLQKIIFQFNFEIAILIFSLSIIYLFHRSIKNFKVESSWFILTFLLIVSLAGILINQTPSDAYLPITFPLVVFTVALFFDYLCSIRIGRLATLTLLSLIILLNSYCGFIISQGNEFMTRMEAADAIIKLAGRSNYNLIGRGAGSQFASFTMNYEYLLWWKGYPLSKKNEKLKIVVMEERGRIFVYKK